MASTLPPGELFAVDSLVTPTAQGIASRVLARTAAGNITLFAFDADEELSEHTAPFDALVLTLSGALVLTIGGRIVPKNHDQTRPVTTTGSLEGRCSIHLSYGRVESC
jgi:quercetin dioxygenase-like cupin family protein